MRDSFQKLLGSSNSMLVLLPNEPDVDPAAAGLALYLYLKSKKYESSIACPSPMRVTHNHLVGVDKISNQPGDKNLVVKLSKYNPDNIDTVIWDIVDGEFHLNVVTKNNATPPQRDQIELTYAGLGSDFVILIGGSEAKHFPLLFDEKVFSAPGNNGESKKTQFAHIGTEDLQFESKHGIISLAHPASSVSELVAEFIDDLETETGADIASNLLTGIFEGSGNFTSNFVSANTFETVANLMKSGGSVQKVKEPQKPQASNPLAQRLSQMYGSSIPMPMMPAMPTQFMQGAAPMANQTPDEYTEQVEGESTAPIKPPVEWTQTPKIYKGTSVS